MEENPRLIPFVAMLDFPELLKAYCRDVERRECGMVFINGKFVKTLTLRMGEVVPVEHYDKKKDALPTRGFLQSTKRSVGCHPNFPVLRKGAVTFALTELCNRGWYPRRMNPRTMPEEGNPKWDNYLKIKSAFTAFYCAAQVTLTL